MENGKTLNELHMELGVSRRAVQRYEKAGLVSASGFSIKEIRTLIDAPESLSGLRWKHGYSILRLDNHFKVHFLYLKQ